MGIFLAMEEQSSRRQTVGRCGKFNRRRQPRSIALKLLNASESWVAADSGKIFRTVDGGSHWLNENTGVRSSLTSLDFADRLHGVAVGGDGVLLRTKNGGMMPSLKGL